MASDALLIRETPDGILIPVTVQPKAKRNGIIGIHAGTLKVAVTIAPEKGKANAAVAAILAETFGIAKQDVTLTSGATSRHKVFLVSNLKASDIMGKLKALGVPV